MRHRKQIMTAVYTVGTLFSFFANFPISVFLERIGVNPIYLERIYISPAHYSSFYLKYFILFALFYFALFIASIVLAVMLIIELEHKKVYFRWGMILLIINIFSIVAFIGALAT